MEPVPSGGLMQRTLSCLCRVIIVLICASWCQAAPKPNPRVDVVVGGDPPELERFAARELCDYLAKLFSIQTYPNRNPSDSADMVFLVGSPETQCVSQAGHATQGIPKVERSGNCAAAEGTGGPSRARAIAEVNEYGDRALKAKLAELAK